MNKRSLFLSLAVALAAFALTVTTVSAQDAPGNGDVPYAADLSDALLLYNGSYTYTTDLNFRRMADYYGLRLAAVDLATTPLTDSLLRDEAGVYYPVIGLDNATLANRLDDGELAVLKTAINSGSHLLVTRITNDRALSALGDLTGGEIISVTYPEDTARDYLLSPSYPAILRELSGLTITASSYDQYDRALGIAPDATHVDVLVQSTDYYSQTYPVFVRVRSGAGDIFLDTGIHYHSLNERQFRVLYGAHPVGDHFEQPDFMEVVPLMAFMRYAAGDEAWHNDHDYANLTIDDPCLQEPFKHLNFADLLSHMEAHNYHTTIASVPGRCYDKGEPDVASLFLNNPDRYSLVVHGDNHDPCPEFTDAVPVEEQRALLEEALDRMDYHQAATGVPYGRVMIFPCKLAGESPLPLLKELNFIATVATQDTPLSGTTSTAWDFEMYPALMDYRNYAVVTRHWQSTSPYPFDLFRDKPVFIYGHERDFEPGIGAYDAIADAINGLTGTVEWHSLDYILKRLYREKEEDDGSVTVRWYTNRLILTNESGTARTYHLQKEEDGTLPIRSLRVNGERYTYTISGGLLTLDIPIAAGETAEISVDYGDDYRNFLPLVERGFPSDVLWQEDFETVAAPPAPNCDGQASRYEEQTTLFQPFSKPDPGFACRPDDCPVFGYVEVGNHYTCTDYAAISLVDDRARAHSGSHFLALDVNLPGNAGSDYDRRIEMRKCGWRTGDRGTWNIGGNEVWRSAWFYIPPDITLDSWIELTDIVERRADGWYEKYNQIVLYPDRRLYIGQQFNGESLHGQVSTRTVPLGEWVHLEEHFFRDPTDGFVEVYLNGELWLANYHLRTMYDPDTAKRGTEISFKLYTAPGTARKTLYWDDITLSRTRLASADG